MSTEQSFKQQIIQKAWEDVEFKKQLLADPKAAVKEAFGVEVPENIKVDVLEENSEQFYLILPRNPSDVQADDQVEVPMWL